jgi:hypothetical protein
VPVNASCVTDKSSAASRAAIYERLNAIECGRTVNRKEFRVCRQTVVLVSRGHVERKSGTEGMAKTPTRSNHDGQHGEMLDVHGFDLLAQVEAMVRHVREYQREVQRLRGTMHDDAGASNAVRIQRLRERTADLRTCYNDFCGTLEDIDAITTALQQGRSIDDRPKR